MAKVYFTLGDIISLDLKEGDSAEPSRKPRFASKVGSWHRAPASPIVDRLMREVGVSNEEINAAYRLARQSLGQK